MEVKDDYQNFVEDEIQSSGKNEFKRYDLLDGEWFVGNVTHIN